MTPAEIEIARRFVACTGWRWRAGMLLEADPPGMLPSAWRIVGEDEFGLEVHEEFWGSFCGLTKETDVWSDEERERAIPVVTDRATQGAILGLVFEKLGFRFCGLVDRGRFWEVQFIRTLPLAPRLDAYTGTTMIEALLAALEAT